MNRIEEYIEKQFSEHAMTTETEELKNEILNNCRERYEECVNAGMSESEAEETVLNTVGNLNDLIEEVASDSHALTVKEETDSKELTTVRVSSLSGDISIKSSEDDEVHVYATENFSHFRLNDTLMVEEEKKNEFSVSRSENRVRIEVPDWLENIVVHTKSGDVSIRNIQLKKCNVMAVSGDVDCKITCESTEISTTSGDVELILDNNAQFKVTTVSGDVDAYLNGVKTGVMETVSGDIETKITEKFEKITLNSVSGDVEADCKKAGGVKSILQTKCGDIDNHAEQVEGYNCLYAKTVSGDIEIR